MKISDLIEIKIRKIEKNSVFFTEKTFLWCKLPYPGHKKGCPNYNKSHLCPPSSKLLKHKLENYNHYYLVYVIFQLREYTDKMLEKHPNWSLRKASCLLYWQNSIRKNLREYIIKIYKSNLNNKSYLFSSGSGYNKDFLSQKHVYSMEAAGINVFKTLKKNDISFEIKPKNYIVLVNLFCSTKKLIF